MAELESSLSAAEFAEWLAFNRVEPLPDPWLQTGTLAAATYNVWRGKGSRPIEPTHFVPRPRKARRGRRLTARQQADFFASYCASQPGE